MPTQPAIVVQEPKELETKPFDKSDIKSIAKETIENLPYEIEMKLYDDWLNGLTLTHYYYKAYVNNCELTIIANGRLKNETESQISIPNDKIMFSLPISEDLQKKIVCHDGVKLYDITSNRSVASTLIMFTASTGSAIGIDEVNLYGNSTTKGLAAYYERLSTRNVNANAEVDFDCRITFYLEK